MMRKSEGQVAGAHRAAQGSSGQLSEAAYWNKEASIEQWRIWI
jgi:hypothetical protein